jgi:hypothetical protein
MVSVSGIVAATCLLANAAVFAELVKVASFGPNPSNAGMHVYVPAKLAPNPAIIVAVSRHTFNQPLEQIADDF